MQTISTFDFATVVCDGCACRVDSQSANDERLHDYDELVDYKLDNMGWEQVDENNDEKWLCPLCVKDKAHRSHPGEGRIIVEKVPTFGLRCDLCGKTFENYEGYSFWPEESIAHEMARNDEWMEVGDKFLCPDCYQTCDAMEDEEEENYKEKYCSKCPYEHDCNEVVPRDRPECSSDCKYAYKGEDGNWKRCPFLETSDGKPYRPDKCCLEANGGKECTRVAYWRDKGKAEQEAENAKARKECNLKEEN